MTTWRGWGPIGAVVVVCAGATASASAGTSVAVLRGNAGEVAAFAVGAGGVTVEAVAAAGGAAGGGAPSRQVLGWDRVARVEGDLSAEAAAYAALATDAWRARARLERGDVAAAEPIFEALFVTQRGQTGPTAALVGGGLMRCRLERGAQVAAVGPWLAYVRAVDDGSGVPAGGGGGGGSGGGSWMLDRVTGRLVLDEASGLAPGMPPIWMATPAVRAAAGADARGDDAGRARVLADLYAASMRFETDKAVGAAQLPPKPAASDDAAQFVWEIVAARAGGDELRKAARQSLRARLARASAPWVEAWCRVAIGRSLLREADRDQQLLGVVELMHLPARLEGENPYLGGIALAEGAMAMLRLGDVDAAVRLRHDLFDRFPGHPATEFEPLRGWVRDRSGNLGDAPAANPADPASPSPGVLKPGPTSPSQPTRQTGGTP